MDVNGLYRESEIVKNASGGVLSKTLLCSRSHPEEVFQFDQTLSFQQLAFVSTDSWKGLHSLHVCISGRRNMHLAVGGLKDSI